jgi:hypothetical protein
MIINSPQLTAEDQSNVTRVPQAQEQQSALEQQQLDQNRPDLTKFLLSLIEQVRGDGQQEKIRRLRKWVRNTKFYEGEQYGYVSPYTGRWVDVDVSEVSASTEDDDDLQFVNNQFRFYVKSLKKEWVRSQTLLRVKARSDKAEKIGAAEFGNDIIFDKQRTLLTEDKKQSESMYATLNGNYYRYSYYSTDVLGGVERIPTFEKTQVRLGPDTYHCDVCKNGGQYTPDMGQLAQAGSIDNTYAQGAPAPQMACPNPTCDNPSVTMEEGPVVEIPVPTGEYQEVKVGDVYTEIPNPMEINVHLHARTLAQTPYLHRERLVLRSVLKQKFSKASLKNGEWQGQQGASSMIQELESSSGNTGVNSSYGKSSSPSTGSPFELLKFDQVWLDIPVYADYVTKQEEKLSDGTVIPAGTALKDIFKRGLYVAVVGNEILNLRNESKVDHWVHGVFDLIPSRFFGDGLEDMVEIQRQLNEVINLRFENMMANAAPSTIFNPLKIDPESFSGKPREMTALINANADDDIRKFVTRLEGSGLDRENFAAEDNYKKDMQTLSGAFSINSGMPDVDISTATGARIVRDAAISMIGPALAIRAKVDVEWAYQVLKLVKSYWTNERYIPRAGNHTKQTGQWFQASDVEGDFEITYVPGSWMPRSEMEEREDFLSFISPEATGLPMGFLNPMVPEQVRSFAAEKYRIPVDLDSNRVHARIAQGRIEKLRKAADELVSNGLLDPEYDFDGLQSGVMPAGPGVMPGNGLPPQPNSVGPGAAPEAVGGENGASQEDGMPTQPSTAPAPNSQPPVQDQSTLVPDPLIGQPAQQPAVVDPMIAMAQMDPNIASFQELLKLVPVRVVVDEHMVFANTYREWLATDDGIDAPTAVQKVLEAKIAQHFLAGAQVQAYLGGLAQAMSGLSTLPGTGGPQPGQGAAPPKSSPGGKPGHPQPPTQGAPNPAQNPAPTPQAVQA